MKPSRVDVRLELLADERRRRVVEYLRRDRRRHATVDELVEHLRRHQGVGPESRDGGPGRSRLELVHRALPKLDAHGVVEWDRRRDEVRYREDSLVEAVLDALGEDAVAVEG